MTELKWEDIKQDDPYLCLRRTKVFGGWLVMAHKDMAHPQYRTIVNEPTMTFIPDPNYEWILS